MDEFTFRGLIMRLLININSYKLFSIDMHRKNISAKGCNLYTLSFHISMPAFEKYLKNFLFCKTNFVYAIEKYTFSAKMYTNIEIYIFFFEHFTKTRHMVNKIYKFWNFKSNKITEINTQKTILFKKNFNLNKTYINLCKFSNHFK